MDLAPNLPWQVWKIQLKAHLVMTKFISGENNQVCAQELIQLTTESSGYMSSSKLWFVECMFLIKRPLITRT